MGFRDRLSHAWNTFLNQDVQTNRRSTYPEYGGDLGPSTGHRPDRIKSFINNERSIVAAMYMRIAIDAASVDIRHVKLDEQDRYVEDVKSGLHNCLNVEANIDQSGRALLQDVYMTMCESGHLAVLPTDMSKAPENGGLFDIQKIRVGFVVNWFPQHVRVRAYNEITGKLEEVTVRKRDVALIENPLYSVMNEPNSTLQRLNRKLSLLDIVDEQSSSGKLDMLIQLPYPIRSEARRKDADRRREDIQFQMKNSQYGIAYIDATEKVTQLNRPAENNLLKQVEYLREMVYTELGLTAGVMNGTATEAEMLNYYNRTIEPVIAAFADELKRKFLTKAARTQGHSIMYFRDPFKLVPMAELAELADKFARNEIVSSNEFRGFIGMRPSADPKADMLINSNLTVPQTQLPGGTTVTGEVIDGEVVSDTDDPFEGINDVLDGVFAELGVSE